MTGVHITIPANPPVEGGGASKPEVVAEKTRAQAAEETKLAKAENLKDITSASAARTNLGLGTAAVEPSTAFDPKGLAATEVIKEEERAKAVEALKASLVSPKLTGTPEAPTAAEGDNSTKIATTAYADRAADEAREDAEAASDPLGAAAAEKTRALAAEMLLAPLASPVLTGTPTATTATESDNSIRVATTAYSDRAANTATQSSAVADYVIAKIGTAIVATPSTPSGLPLHTGTESEVGTIINAAIKSLKGSGRLHLALAGEVSVNDAELVINEGFNASNPVSWKNRLIITGDGSTELRQTSAGKNTLKIENASTVDLSGFRLYSGASAGSALLLANTGANSEISAVGSNFWVYASSDSTSSPAVLIQNGYHNSWPMLFAKSSANHGLRIENTSTVTNYGNSTFGYVQTSAKAEIPYAGLSIVTTNSGKYPNLMSFAFFHAEGPTEGGYYGLYCLGAKNCTFEQVDIETMPVPVFLGGNAEGAKTHNVRILSGVILPESGEKTTITCTQYTSGNSVIAKIGGGNSSIPIKDEVVAEPAANNGPLNSYDLCLEDTASAANVLITNPSTPITFRRQDGAVRSPAGTNRKLREYTANHTFKTIDMGLVTEYNAAGAGTFFVPKNSEEERFPVGTIIRVYQAGAGQLTVTPNVEVTLRNPTGYTFTQYGMAELWCSGENEWVLAPLSGGLAAEAVTTEKIKNEAVTEGKIATGAVTEAKIGAEAVGTTKIKALAVTEAKIANGAVGTEKLAAEAVATGKIKLLAITTGLLAEGAVSTEKIKATAVTEEKLGAEAVSSAKIKNEGVTEPKIANVAVTEAKIAFEAVATTKIKNEAITGAKIATGAVTTEKLGNEAVGTTKVKSLAITEEKLAAEAVSSSKVKPGTTPVPSAEENKVVNGTVGVARKFVAALTGNGVLTKFKVVHNLGTRATVSTILTETFEEPVTMLAKVVSLNENEVEVTFTLALGAKVANYLVLVG